MNTTSVAEQRMRVARTQLMMGHPFFGVPSMRLELVECPGCGTAFTDGISLGFDPVFVKACSGNELQGLVAHEALHCMMEHFARRADRDPHKWNVACDYSINWMLVKAGFRLPKGGLYDKKYENMDAETIFNKLPDNLDYASMMKDNPFGEVRDCPGAATAEKGEPQPVPVGATEPGGGEDGEAPADMSPEQLADGWKKTMEQAAEMAKMQGLLPSYLERAVQKIIYPDPDLAEKLLQFVERHARNDYQWTRPNRRYIMTGAIVPSLQSNAELPPFLVVMDTSGSISKQMLSETGGTLQYLLDTFETEITALYVDAKAHNHERFISGDTVELHPKGGGGTDFRPAFRWAEKHMEEMCCLVYITDMHGTFPKEPPNYPVLWVKKGSYADYPNPPFGEVVGAGKHWS